MKTKDTIKNVAVVLPAYNEEKTILQVLENLKELQLIHGIEKEIIIINDCSKDQSLQLITDFIQTNQNQTFISIASEHRETFLH
jgi:glycosyltransferase involved in cell wall biosynthesis